MLDGCIPRYSANLLPVRFSAFIKSCNFSRIFHVFYKDKAFFFCKQAKLYKCDNLISVDNCYICQYVNYRKITTLNSFGVLRYIK
jgi:hypothetical protein